ncbi:helix-turn-helix domain-containing protein [Actinospica sp.]|uniref:MmyB family transcriptional regulator n=1 Tax=Actinospica sp. TaxID=1872142 RepID=UPI002C0250F9|nr:helix-turn-helix domain-containing protein [Actinospica sp.]HWG24257.1 helix-turn-helix domain-containing protein [Actinospica sp.]
MTDSSNELGATLRRWRDRLSPDQVGLPVERHRRARGLRRVELASLAGMSADYLVQLEQGRAGAPSSQVLGALAAALRLTEAERSYLFHLAGRLEPGGMRVSPTVPDGVRRMVQQLSASPAIVCDARWNPVAWNAMWASAIGDPLRRPERERNMVWRHFTGLPSRVMRTRAETGEFEEAVVADLRSSSGRYPHDEHLAHLVGDLRESSARFRGLWETRHVGIYNQERKTVEHPYAGRLQLDCDILTTYRSDLRVVVCTAAAGSPSAKALDELCASRAER